MTTFPKLTKGLILQAHSQITKIYSIVEQKQKRKVEKEWRLKVSDKMGMEVDHVDYTINPTKGLSMFVNGSSMESKGDWQGKQKALWKSMANLVGFWLCPHIQKKHWLNMEKRR